MSDLNEPPHDSVVSSSSSNKVVENHDDPSHVWKQSNVATTFTDIRDSVPLNKEQLDLMIRIIRYFVVVSEHASNNPITFLDLGCGDGPLSRKLLQEFPNARGILLDFSDPMLEGARKKIVDSEATPTSGSSSSRLDQISFVKGDLSNPNWKDSVLQVLSSSSTNKNENDDTTPTTNTHPSTSTNTGIVDVVVSSFAIHHLTDERKRELYTEIYDNILKPGGIFLNLEHVASPTTKVEGIFDGAFVDSMYEHFGGTKTREECQHAVSYDLSVDDDANLLAPVETQCDWLRQISYSHVDCYFKFLILALFGGVKEK